ncbi:hypothetical protein KDI_51620 [Dictyobacter arantiisoli]|uniref:Uncharacterized protein n=1 Tax=Dictyobacter arantiisoli TaxID=2014874 RepID=A0A5A5TK34_9CHLR|nr:hypothetical protein KDI_51620 [Dictyobacter arantiisoli]
MGSPTPTNEGKEEDNPEKKEAPFVDSTGVQPPSEEGVHPNTASIRRMWNADASVDATLHGWRGIAITPQSRTRAGGKESQCERVVALHP